MNGRLVFCYADGDLTEQYFVDLSYEQIMSKAHLFLQINMSVSDIFLEEIQAIDNEIHVIKSEISEDILDYVTLLGTAIRNI